MKRFMKRFVKDEGGQGLIEYGVIAALIILIAIAAVTKLGQSTGKKLDDVNEKLQ